MRYEFFIALRYLRSKTRLAFIPIITFISVAGVALGVMALVVVLSVMNGFESDLREKMLGNYSHIQLIEYSGIPNHEEVMAAIKNHPGVLAAAPSHLSEAMIRTENTGKGALIKAIDPKYETGVSDLEKNLVLGSLESLHPRPKEQPTDQNQVELSEISRPLPGVILGKELAKNLFLIDTSIKEVETQLLQSILGSPVDIVSVLREHGPLGGDWRSRKFVVAGIFESGLYDFDKSHALIGLDPGKYLFQLDWGVTRIEIKLKDVNQAVGIAQELEEDLDEIFLKRFELKPWTELNKVFFTALQIEKIAMFVILVMIVMVAAFNIASTLIMVVMEKTRDIGILRSLGAGRRGIMMIFFIKGIFIGVVGTVIGLVFGIGICLFLEFYGLELPGQGAIYYIPELPVEIRGTDLSLVTLLTLLTCLLSSLYPAWQAAKLIPVEALRYD